MAAASLFSVGKTVLEKLGPLIQQEVSSLWTLRAELEKLKGTMSAIQAHLLDAEEKQEHSHQVKDWLEKLTVLLYDAEDLLDDVATEDLRSTAPDDDDDDDDLSCKIRCWSAVCFLFISLPNRLLYGVKMSHRVKSLREQLDVIYADNTNLHLNLNPRSEEKGKMRNHARSVSLIPDIVVGREDDINKIKTLLLSANDIISVVSIVGIGGMGKTTLAQLVYNDEEIKEWFELRLWVCVSEAFETSVIARKILESATKAKQPQDLQLDTLTTLLDREIHGKKYLLVLDDVWNFDPEKWSVLRSALARGGTTGSKILVTTRFENFAESMRIRGSPAPYTLHGLSPSLSWSLVMKVALASSSNDGNIQNITGQEQEEEIKRLIMNKSAGVPLAVKAIANLLHFKKPQTEWLTFLRSSQLLGVGHQGSLLHNLKLSYDYLPSHLKRCFLCCIVYPKGSVINVQHLIYQWSALGLIKKPDDHDSRQSIFEIGLEYFTDLAWRSFFQEIKRNWDGNVKRCKMHDLIHDLATSIAGSSFKQLDFGTDELSERTYHICLNHGLWSPSDLILHLGKAKRLQSFYLGSEKWCRSGTNWDESSFKCFVLKFRSLRILDFTNSAMEMVPRQIQDLKHLRLLDLSFEAKMTCLPSNITMLVHLQVLVLHGCRSLQELPMDIIKLVNLWCLNATCCFALTHMPKGLGKLSQLEKLTWFAVGKDNGLNELSTLNNLGGELEIVNLRYLRDQGTMSSAFEIGALANMKAKCRLEWLQLHWNNGDLEKEDVEWEEWLNKCSEEDVEWDESLLESLEPHSNLKVLDVFCYRGWNLPSWISSLTNLKGLTLAMCKVRRGLHHLQGLPLLERLMLFQMVELEYMDEDEEGDELLSFSFFISLEYLQLSNCPKLKGWKKSKKQDTTQFFPKLSKLIIHGCPLLEWMPSFPTLDNKLELMDTSLQPLIDTIKFRVSVDVHQYYPLSKLKKLIVTNICNPPKEWLQGMQHLTSLQEMRIQNCSGLEETLYWKNVSHVPNIYVDGQFIDRETRSWLDEDEWNDFGWVLQAILKVNAESEG